MVHELYLLLPGLSITLGVSFLALIIGLICGTAMGICASRRLRNHYIGPFTDAYIFLVQGTPIYIQILLIYFGLPELWGGNIHPLTAGVIAVGMNSIAYVSQIVRAGVNVIPRGQWEAAYVLGYSLSGMLRYIILPQTVKNILPALGNEIVSLVKETSILGTIGVLELTKVSRDMVNRTMEPITWYLAAALLYLLVTTTLSYGVKLLERSFEYDHRH